MPGYSAVWGVIGPYRFQLIYKDPKNILRSKVRPALTFGVSLPWNFEINPARSPHPAMIVRPENFCFDATKKNRLLSLTIDGSVEGHN